MITALTAFAYTVAVTAGLLLGDGSQKVAALLVALVLAARALVRRRRTQAADARPHAAAHPHADAVSPTAPLVAANLLPTGTPLPGLGRSRWTSGV